MRKKRIIIEKIELLSGLDDKGNDKQFFEISRHIWLNKSAIMRIWRDWQYNNFWNDFEAKFCSHFSELCKNVLRVYYKEWLTYEDFCTITFLISCEFTILGIIHQEEIRNFFVSSLVCRISKDIVKCADQRQKQHKLLIQKNHCTVRSRQGKVES